MARDNLARCGAAASLESLESRQMLSQTTYTVTNTSDSGSGSLRAALINANALLPGVEAQIAFDLPTGLNTIDLLSPLPFITAEVDITGPTNSKGDPQVELNGAGAGLYADGLFLDRDTPGNTLPSTISGLIINNFGAAGIDVHNGAAIIYGCRIGTDAAGGAAEPNGQQGILLESSNCTIGEPAVGPAFAVVISGNTGDGILITGTDDTIQHCFIGTDADGVKAIPNGGWGIEDTAGNNSIGTTNAHGANVISGNALGGVRFTNSGDQLEHNKIGTDINGVKAVPNTGVGVEADGASLFGIGEPIGAYGGNVISGNTQSGVSLVNTMEGLVSSDMIGTNAAGTAAIGNTKAGVYIDGNKNSVELSLISGNGFDGVVIEDDSVSATKNQISNNRIGTDVTGKKPIPNLGDGVLLGSVTDTLVEANTIAFNSIRADDGFGVDILGSDSTGNAVRFNSIFSNGRLGINLGDNDGKVLKNDTKDIDVGPNFQQNYPVLTSAKTSGAKVTAKGTLNSEPNTTYYIEFYASPTADPSGFGEGKTFEGYIKIKTDASGNATFHLIFTAPAAGSVITTTATDLFGDTSEFSNAKKMS